MSPGPAVAAIASSSSSPTPASSLARRMSHFFTAGRAGEAHPFPELTTRERDVLDLLADGRPNADIAGSLGLSEKTVRNNVSNIFAKLLVADRAAAVAKARSSGLGTESGTQR